MTKDYPRTTAGELHEIVESWGQKTFKINFQTAPTCFLRGFQEKLS